MTDIPAALRIVINLERRIFPNDCKLVMLVHFSILNGVRDVNVLLQYLMEKYDFPAIAHQLCVSRFTFFFHCDEKERRSRRSKAFSFDARRSKYSDLNGVLVDNGMRNILSPSRDPFLQYIESRWVKLMQPIRHFYIKIFILFSF